MQLGSTTMGSAMSQTWRKTAPLAVVAAALIGSASPASAQRMTTEVPINRTSTEVPTAIQQQYLSRGLDQALAQLDWARMKGLRLRLDIVEIAPSPTLDIPSYLRSGVGSSLAMHDGSIVLRGGNGQFHLRVKQAGMDRVTVEHPYQVKRSPVLPVVMMAVGGVFVLSGIGMAADFGDASPLFVVSLPAAGLAYGGYSLLTWRRKNPKNRVRKHVEYRMRVSLDATIVPKGKKAWSDVGEADLVVTD
ncbi:MAG: hypothetical protein ACI9MC_001246 [Kiritimatiellia bacterium]|jgi:hypothetical protein